MSMEPTATSCCEANATIRFTVISFVINSSFVSGSKNHIQYFKTDRLWLMDNKSALMRDLSRCQHSEPCL